MASTKLHKEQNEYRKALRKDALHNGAEIFRAGRYTIVAIHERDNVRFAVSMASVTETKWRRKVGEFHALQRFFGEETTVLHMHQYTDLVDSMLDDYSDIARLE